MAIDFNLLVIIIEICINRMSDKYFNKQKINIIDYFHNTDNKIYNNYLELLDNTL